MNLKTYGKKMLNSLALIALVGFSLTANICYADKTKQSDTPKMHSDKKVKLLAFSGSTRKDSCNAKALTLLANATKEAGAEVTLISLNDYSMPIYDGDLESAQGLPENAKKLQKLISEHDGLLIASPEYNGLPSPLLKNVLDWASRTDESNTQSGRAIFEGKVAAIISASPSSMGGSRGSQITAQFLSNLGLKVVPERVAIANCPASFNANGEVTDKKIMNRIKEEAGTTVKMARTIK